MQIQSCPFLLMMMISSLTFMKNVEWRLLISIWLITSSFCRAPNEWYEMQAKILHDFNIILNENEYDCPGSITVMGRYYLVMYEGELWPGQVTEVKSGGQIITVKCLEKIDAPKGSTWKWSVKKDEHDYPICDVKQKIERPQLYTMF